jgi:hypothetical protein
VSLPPRCCAAARGKGPAGVRSSNLPLPLRNRTRVCNLTGKQPDGFLRPKIVITVVESSSYAAGLGSKSVVSIFNQIAHPRNRTNRAHRLTTPLPNPRKIRTTGGNLSKQIAEHTVKRSGRPQVHQNPFASLQGFGGRYGVLAIVEGPSACPRSPCTRARAPYPILSAQTSRTECQQKSPA